MRRVCVRACGRVYVHSHVIPHSRALLQELTRARILYSCTDFCVSGERATRDFNYNPEFSVDEAIRRTVAHYKALGYAKNGGKLFV